MSSEVKQWLEEATQILSAAQTIGDKANTQLNATKSTINLNNTKLTKGNFLLDSSSQLIHLLETIYASIELRLDDRRKNMDVLSSFLSYNLTQLTNEYDNLKQIKIDPNLLSGDQKSLYDFISTEILDLLLQKQNELNSTKSNYIKHIEDQQYLLKSNLENFNENFDKIESEMNEINESTWIPTLIEENNSFEEEIATLLESITNHYDQCNKGVKIINGEITIPEDEKTHLFEVLRNDSNEVHDVLKDFEESFNDIEQRCIKIENYLNGKFFDKKLNHLIQDLNKFGQELQEIINELDTNNTDVQTLSKEINEICKESENLISHYQNFAKTYYNMILEINRRGKVQSLMQTIISETQTKLESLQNDDFKKRGTFLKNNGIYLPNDLWNDVNDNSPLFNLDFSLVKLPELNSSTLTTAKKKVNE